MPTTGVPASELMRKFTGKERDSESGLDDFPARYFTSSMGRWMTPDIMGGHADDPQTLNKYAYARNNPVSLTDPTGLDSYLSCTHTDQNGSTRHHKHQLGTDLFPFPSSEIILGLARIQGSRSMSQPEIILLRIILLQTNGLHRY